MNEFRCICTCINLFVYSKKQVIILNKGIKNVDKFDRDCGNIRETIKHIETFRSKGWDKNQTGNRVKVSQRK